LGVGDFAEHGDLFASPVVSLAEFRGDWVHGFGGSGFGGSGFGGSGFGVDGWGDAEFLDFL
jgi:hypothetical protein